VHLTTSPADWYAARAAGIVALVLLSTVVALGIGLADKKRPLPLARFAVEDVHRFLGLLTGAFIAVHVLTIAIDAYLPFSPVQIVVPLLARYRPLWTGLGIAAAELLVALAVANHYRTRMPYRFWRRSHYLNFAVWSAAIIHSLGTGTDSHARWAIVTYVALIVLVLTLAARRALHGRAWIVAPVAGLAIAAVLIAVTSRPTPRPVTSAITHANFNDRLSGIVVQQQGQTAAIVSMSGRGHGEQPLLVRADLLVTNVLQSTSLQVEFLPSGRICAGHVTQVESRGFSGRCLLPNGRAFSVRASWTIARNNNVAGKISARRT
jgi:methionine sulfoxide reductase heme-binding subunit